MCLKEVQDVIKQISDLSEKMKIIEEEINVQTEILKDLFLKSSMSMKESQNYLLAGIQTSPVSRSYLVTFRGIEVLGEETISVPIFIDTVLHFAHFPKRKIEVLKELAIHLDGLRRIINN